MNKKKDWKDQMELEDGDVPSVLLSLEKWCEREKIGIENIREKK